MTLGRSVVSVAKQHYSRVLHTSKGHPASSHQSQPDMDHLFCYTSGRWLWNEREKLEARIDVLTSQVYNKLLVRPLVQADVYLFRKLAKATTIRHIV